MTLIRGHGRAGGDEQEGPGHRAEGQGQAHRLRFQQRGKVIFTIILE